MFHRIFIVLLLKIFRPNRQFCFYFQSESPASDQLNKLGVYLIVSLFFVISTIIELAFVVTLKRVGELKVQEGENEVKVMTRSKIESRKQISILDRIDFFAFMIYFFFYIIFNFVYWIHGQQY